MYRQKINSVDNDKKGENKDLKDFYLKAHIPTDSMKTVSNKVKKECVLI